MSCFDIPSRNDFLPTEKNLIFCQVYGNDVHHVITQDSWYTVIICQTTPYVIDLQWDGFKQITQQRVGRILLISSNSEEISPLARLQVRTRKICIYTRIADLGQFWPIFAQKCFGFSEHNFLVLSTST